MIQLVLESLCSSFSISTQISINAIDKAMNEDIRVILKNALRNQFV